jgi:hypothetical protein
MPRRLLRSPGRLVGLVATLTLVVPAASGCAPPIDPQTAAAEGRSFAPIAVRAPGPASLVVDAFAEVPLDPAQRRAVATLAAETARRHAAVGQAMKEAASALASQIEVGKVDRGIMQTHVEAIAAAWVRSQPRDRDAIQDLHELLDIEQRQLLADAIEDRAGRSLRAPIAPREVGHVEGRAGPLRGAGRRAARRGPRARAPRVGSRRAVASLAPAGGEGPRGLRRGGVPPRRGAARDRRPGGHRGARLARARRGRGRVAAPHAGAEEDRGRARPEAGGSGPAVKPTRGRAPPLAGSSPQKELSPVDPLRAKDRPSKR